MEEEEYSSVERVIGCGSSKGGGEYSGSTGPVRGDGKKITRVAIKRKGSRGRRLGIGGSVQGIPADAKVEGKDWQTLITSREKNSRIYPSEGRGGGEGVMGLWGGYRTLSAAGGNRKRPNGS